MDAEFSQIFLYLACIYVINGLLINIFRRLKLSDFIAHILTGIIFGLILWGVGGFLGLDFHRLTSGNFTQIETEANTLPKLIAFLSYLGLVLFLVQLGFNFDWSIFKTIRGNNIYAEAGLFCFLTAVIVGSLTYLQLGYHYLTSLFLVIAFISINIGAVLSSHFPISVSYKKSFAKLIQIAVILDIIAILLFNAITFYFGPRTNRYSANPEIELLFWVVVLLFVFPVILPQKTQKLFSFLQRWIQDFTLLLVLGFIFLFLYAGFQVRLSVLFLGVWAGMLYKSVIGESQYEINQKFFAAASFLYVLPFVEIGRALIVPIQFSNEFWFNLCTLLAALMLIALLLALVVSRKTGKTAVIFLGAFPRGELTVIMLWLFREIHPYPSSIFITSVIVVIVSSLFGSVLSKIILKKDKSLQLN